MFSMLNVEFISLVGQDFENIFTCALHWENIKNSLSHSRNKFHIQCPDIEYLLSTSMYWKIQEKITFKTAHNYGIVFLCNDVTF